MQIRKFINNIVDSKAYLYLYIAVMTIIFVGLLFMIVASFTNEIEIFNKTFYYIFFFFVIFMFIIIEFLPLMSKHKDLYLNIPIKKFSLST